MPRSGARARSAPLGPRSGKLWGFIAAWGRFPQGNGGALRSWQKARHDPTVHCSWWLLVVKPWTTSTHQNYLISPKTSLFFSFYIAPWSFILSLSHYFCFLLYLLPRVFTFYLSHYLSLTRAPWGGMGRPPPAQPRTCRAASKGSKKERSRRSLHRARPGLGAARARRNRAFIRARGASGVPRCAQN